MGAIHLSAALKVNKALYLISMISALEQFFHLLKQKVTSNNSVNDGIGDIGAKAIAESLKVNKTLSVLALWSALHVQYYFLSFSIKITKSHDFE